VTNHCVPLVDVFFLNNVTAKYGSCSKWKDIIEFSQKFQHQNWLRLKKFSLLLSGGKAKRLWKQKLLSLAYHMLCVTYTSSTCCQQCITISLMAVNWHKQMVMHVASIICNTRNRHLTRVQYADIAPPQSETQVAQLAWAHTLLVSNLLDILCSRLGIG